MRKLWEFFNSLKLTVYLVLAITAVSMYGSFVIYLHPRIFGAMDMQIFFPFLLSAGLRYLGQSWWLFLLLFLAILFGINTFVCTVERLPRIFKRYKNPLLNLREVGEDRGVAVGLDQSVLSERLAKEGYKVFTRDHLLFAERNRLLPFLPYAVHIGVLLFLVAHLVSGLAGYRHSDIRISEGETVMAPEGDYSLRLDKVRVDYRDDGSLKDYGSELTAIKDGREIKKAFVGANRPMFVAGGAVYQREFGQDFNGIVLQVNVKSAKSSGNLLIRKGEDYADLQGTPYRIHIDRFLNDFALDGQGEPFSNSDELANPAAMITLQEEGKARSVGWLFAKTPARDTFHDPDVEIKFVDLDLRAYSTFDINRDPSALMALIASLVIMFGSIITLYVRRERVWAEFKDGKARVVASDEEIYDKIK